MAIPGTGQKMGDSPSGGFGYREHMDFDAPTIQAGSPRITQDYQENLLGHRSGIFNDPTNSRSSGLQTAILVYGTGVGPVTPSQSWWGQQKQRCNPEGQ